MLVRISRLVTVMFVGLSMGPALCHLLEMPAKLDYDGALWLRLLHTLYPPAFGTVGAFFEVGAVVLAGVLAFLVRHRQPAFGWTLLGALCLVSSHAAFWIWIVPVNLTMTSLTPETLPADWMRLRAQWEYTHAVRAVLQTAALGALVFSILIETPTHASGNQSA
jgi:hypothetical protein